MEVFNIIAILISLAAVFSYINFRFLHLSRTIGMMLLALLLSLILIGLNQLGWSFEKFAAGMVRQIDFHRLLLNGMLSFLLFAGALVVNLDDLLPQKFEVLALATVGVLLSTVIVGGVLWFIFSFFKNPVPLIYCLLFGALISPTDPVAVLAMLKTARASKSLEALIAGEALFNDGMGIVVFITILNITLQEGGSTAGVAILFAREVAGGVLFGLITGLLAYQLLKSVDEYTVEILITLALVMGGYALADSLGLSGPLAIVVAGLLIGNHGRSFAMSARTRERLDLFWELVDEILNVILFILLGFEVLALELKGPYLLAGLLVIPVILLARLISVAIPIHFFRWRKPFRRETIGILTWGGLRGGIAVALALSLPAGPYRGGTLTVTYVVVIFSILVQGLTTGKILKRMIRG